MSGYQWIKTDLVVQRLSDGAFIPNDTENRDWRLFQEFVKVGGVPLDAPPPEPIPDLSKEKLMLKDKTATADDRLEALIKLLGL